MAIENVYLNGSENRGRLPISFLLVAEADRGKLTETQLVDAYAEALEREGRELDPFNADRAWWTYYAFGEGGEVRLGPASRFAEMATADEGYARPRFRRVISEEEGPFIVVAIDLQDQ